MQAAIDQRVCIHCGTGFRPTDHRPDFCCAGCEFVHDLIAKNGLSQFYDLQDGPLPPVKSLVFHPRDYQWLETLLATLQPDAGGVCAMKLDLQGVSCIGCVWLIEKLFGARPGGLSISADPSLGQMDLRWRNGEFDVIAFARELQTFGYLVGPLGVGGKPADRGLSIRLGVCAALAMNTMLFTLPRYLGMEAGAQWASLFQRVALILGTLSFVIGGSYFFVRSWQSLRRGVLHIDVPISMGIIAAWVGSVYAFSKGVEAFVYFDFVAMFVFLMLVGRWLQQKVVARNRNQLLAAQADPPPVRTKGDERMPVAKLVIGDIYWVESGGIVPVSSRLQSVAATLGMEWINGESEAAVAQRGRIMPAGALNCGEAAIACEAMEVWGNSFLSKLLRATPAGTSRDMALERFIRNYTWVVLGIALSGFVTWWISGGALLPALQVLISVLVVSCPCASGVALPLCSDLAASHLRKVGVFVRDAGIWGRLHRIAKIVFDKTGTLTLETISLRNPAVLGALTIEERAVLLSIVHDSRHPVSGCLREQLFADGVEPQPIGSIHEEPGHGLEVEALGSTWRLGRVGWAADGVSGAESDCVFARDGRVLSRFHFGEEARLDAADEIHELRRGGYGVFILSGDRNGKVQAMAERLGLAPENCLGELTPADKAAQVAALDQGDTLYLGDGANDCFAFDHATVTGTPAVDRGLLEQKADFYFLGRGLAGVRALLEMGARRRMTARAVMAFAICYNLVAIFLSLTGRMSPLLAAILMPASSLVSLAIVFLGMQGKHRAGLRLG